MTSTLAFAEARPAMQAQPSIRVATSAALLALACVLGLVEASLPALPVVPWLRLGLANIPVVIALVLGAPRIAAAVSGGRLLIIGLATGSLGTPVFVLALAGASASFLVMWALSTRPSLTAVGWSAAGSAAHVVAQFLAASVLLDAPSVLRVAPPSALIALALGALVGYLARIAVSRLQLG